ncbi:MAG: TolC family protein [Bacteroidetes bacterium]|nr:TolC family protein [Candidatus Cryptobacteroides excrementipullorum]
MEYLSDTGVPDMLLTRRPDIKEAEMMLAAADCDIKAARKAFYPGLRLGGAGGFNAFDIGRLFLAPASLAYEIAAGLTAPVFNAGKIRNEYSDALVRRDMAVNNYKETVVKAYSEVCGLIESSENIRERIDVKKEEMKIGKKATASANELFRMQFIGYLEVLAADRDYFECCESYIDLEIERMKLQADLYRALGGGGFPAEGTATAQ